MTPYATKKQWETAFAMIFRECLDLKDGSDVLLIHDETFDRFLPAIEHSIESLKLGATMIRVPVAEQERLLQARAQGTNDEVPLPQGLVGALLESSVVLNCLGGGHMGTSQFRRAVLHARIDGSRFAHVPGLTEEVLEIMLRTPLREIQTSCEILAWALGEAKTIVVETTDRSGGSHKLTLNANSWDNEPLISSGVIAVGSWGNIPPGEVFCCPDPAGVNGEIVINGSVPGNVLTAADEAILSYKNGRMQWKCAEHTATARFFEDQQKRAKDHRDLQWNCFAELGFGLNPAIDQLTGNSLFDEKAIGTLHVAFGDNSIFGHKLHANVHADLVTKAPNVRIDGQTVMTDGKIDFDAIKRRRATFPAMEGLPSQSRVRLRKSRCEFKAAKFKRRLQSGGRIGHISICHPDQEAAFAELCRAFETYDWVRPRDFCREHPSFGDLESKLLIDVLHHYRMLKIAP